MRICGDVSSLAFSAARRHWPLAARAQQQAMPVIGLLDSTSPDATFDPVALRSAMASTKRAMSRAGTWRSNIVGRMANTIGCRNWRPNSFAVGDRYCHDRLAATVGTGGEGGNQRDPGCIPDRSRPGDVGLVASLNRPGGNVTGVTSLSVELARSGWNCCTSSSHGDYRCLASNPTNPFAETLSRELQAAARTLGLQPMFFMRAAEGDLDSIFATYSNCEQVASSSAAIYSSIAGANSLPSWHSHAMPTIYQYRAFAAAGGLMSYGSSFGALRQTGIYTGRILKGEKPADLPVQQSTKVELIINLKTAKTLGITVHRRSLPAPTR